MSVENMTLEEVTFWSKGASDTLDEIDKKGLYRCPVCKKLMVGRPCDWNICGSCHREFGYEVPHYYNEIPVWSPADFEK
jgi:hypothetical protein